MNRLELDMFQIQYYNNSSISTMQPTVRFNDISILRVSAMLMVVFYHCLCPYSIWDGTDFYIGFHVPIWDVVDGMLAQIHLPIFFLISGYLYGYKRNLGGYSDNVKFVKDKTLRVLVPYTIVGLFLCLLQDRDISQMLNGISHLWFLMTIFECYVLGMLVDTVLKMQERKVQIVMGGLVLFIVLIPYRIPVMQFLCLSNIIKYFPFYMLGMLASKMNFRKYTKYKAKTLVLIIILLLFFALQQVYVKKTLITMLLGVSIVSFIFIYARCLNIPKLPSWVTSLDKCSMGIYIVHHIVIQEMNPCFPFHELAVNHYYAYPIFQFFIVTGVSWLFVAVCQNLKYSKYILG